MPGNCRKCGVPRLLSLTQVWRDGCIVDTTSGSASLCIYEGAYPTTLVAELEDRLGVPLDRIVYLAGTHAAVKALGVLYESHPRIGRFLFSAPLHGFTERLLIGFGRAIGVAKVDMVERRRGTGAKVTIADPFDLWNCLAIISGILQIADRIPITYDILDGNGSFLVDFIPAPEDMQKDEAYQRLFAENLTPRRLDASPGLNKCDACSAPRDVGRLLEFDTARGFIKERPDGERMIFMGVHGFNSIIRELGWELGHSVNEIFIDFERRHLSAKLDASGDAGTFWDEDILRGYLAVRGLGMLVEMREKDGTSSLTVYNAFIAPLVAGRLLAFWEKAHGRSGAYTFDVTDDTLRFSIS